MTSANRTVEEVQLEGYYTAALAFIDPQLTLQSELTEVEAAALQHHRELAELPPQLAAGDIEQLAEAVEFIRRSHARLAEAQADPGGDVTPDLTASVLPAIELSAFVADKALHRNGDGHSSNGHHAEDISGHASWDVPDQAAAAPDITAAVATEIAAVPASPAIIRRRSPLHRIWEDQAAVTEHSDELPEVGALPLLRGVALLAYEAWLVIFAGWVATRFSAWPHEPLSFDITLAGHGLFLLGLLTSAVAAWLVYRYRNATRNIAGLVHAGAALVAFDLLAWQLEVARDTLPRISAPGPAHWEILVAAWLVFGAAAHLADLRSR
ncbi:MAG: hypothetical protein M3R04_03510 [bacterium]|nr:hypothetical protein [bacterium]